MLQHPTVRVREGVLQRLREIHRLPSEDAQARLIGVDRTTLRRIDAGASPSAAFIAGATLAFGVSFDTLFTVVPAQDCEEQPAEAVEAVSA